MKPKRTSRDDMTLLEFFTALCKHSRSGSKSVCLFQSRGEARFSCREKDHRHADNQIIHRDGRPQGDHSHPHCGRWQGRHTRFRGDPERARKDSKDGQAALEVCELDFCYESRSRAMRPIRQSIPGIKGESAASILAKIGADMELFPTAAQLSSWAKLCPANHEGARNKKSQPLIQLGYAEYRPKLWAILRSPTNSVYEPDAESICRARTSDSGPTRSDESALSSCGGCNCPRRSRRA